MLEFFMSKPAKQLYWIRQGNMEKLEACYRNEGLFPETEEALLEPMNRGVLLEFLKWGRFKEVANELRLIVLHIERPKEIEAYFRSAKSPETEKALLEPKNKAVLLDFLKWGKLEDVAHIMELYLTRYRDEFIRNRRQGVSFDEDNLLMLIALCREYPVFLQEYVRRNGALKTEYERVLFAYADISCIEWYACEIWYSMQALLFGYKSGIFKDSLQEYVRKHGKLTPAQEDALFANADEDLLEWYVKEAGYSTDDFSFCARLAKLERSCYLQEYIRQHYDCRKRLSPDEERRAFFFGDDSFRREYLYNFDLDLGNLVRDIGEYGGSRDAIIAQDKKRVWRLLEKLDEACREFPSVNYLRVVYYFKWQCCTNKSSSLVPSSSVISSNKAETLVWDTYRYCWITEDIYPNSKLETIILAQVQENLVWLLNTLEDVAYKNRKAHHLE